MQYSIPHVAFEGFLRRESTITHGAPIVDLGSFQVAFKRNLRHEFAIAHGAPIMSLRGRQVALERVFGIKGQVAIVTAEMAAGILQMALKCGRGGKLSIAGLALKLRPRSCQRTCG